MGRLLVRFIQLNSFTVNSNTSKTDTMTNTTDNNKSQGALEGLRVLDLSRVLAGPFCSMLLGDMGAEILKVETPREGDCARDYPPFLHGFSAYFANLNRNKKSIAIDLKNNDGKTTILELVKECDIILENFKPGTMYKLGLSYDVLKEINPRIVYASISGFGQYGPYKDRPGYDIIGQAVGGLMSVSGWPDSPPTRTGTAMGDILAGLNCCVGILAALQSRERTGKGQYIDVSLVDSVVSSMETIIQLYLVENRIPSRIGNRYEFIYPYDSFVASDGWVVIGVGGDEIWKRFCVTIERSDLLENKEFKRNRDRVANHEKLNKIVTDWTSKHTITEIVDLLFSHSIPCAPIYTIDKIVNDPHIAEAREMIVEMKHPIEGSMKVINSAIKFSDTKTSIRTTAPKVGEHTMEIITNILCKSEVEYENLKKNGAFGE
jgi:crotonobetainyl-CoA:carnitine CoA-transferase CaiB-like acyl-CoA transferase